MEVVGRRGRDRRTSRWECILIMRVSGLRMVIYSSSWDRGNEKEAEKT
jgi:hypothetical protein